MWISHLQKRFPRTLNHLHKMKLNFLCSALLLKPRPTFFSLMPINPCKIEKKKLKTLFSFRIDQDPRNFHATREVSSSAGIRYLLKITWELTLLPAYPLLVIPNSNMSYRKHGFWVVTERCFKQTAMKYVEDSIKLSPYCQFCCPLHLISTSPSANIACFSPRFFGEFDIPPANWKNTRSQFYAAN